MTLDEAREQLGLTATATVDEIREAFRRKARKVHPDRHPAASSVDRARLGLEFDRAREARDILVDYTSHRLRNPLPPSPSPGNARRPSPAPGDSPRAKPQASRTANAARVTMRFDEFTAWIDSTGFGAGVRSPRYVDWTRWIVWSLLGLAVVGVVGGGAVLALTA